MKTNTLFNSFSPKKAGVSVVSLMLLAIAAFSIFSVKNNEKVSADSPTFFFSTSSSCGSSATSISRSMGATTVYLCVDGDNEGEGLLGAEATASYAASYVDVTDITCNAFDTCIDLSEEGAIKLLAASGLPNEGGDPVDSQENFASISLNLLQEGETTLSFTTAKIINDNQDVEVRSGLSLTITVGGSTGTPDVICGNGVINTGENCDGSNLNGETCEGLGYDGGTLSCNNCLFDTSSCTTTSLANCGNGTIDSGEECDGSNLSGQSCVSLGFTGGSLSCSGSCSYNFAACEGLPPNNCPNGVVETPFEECDDGNYIDGDGCSSVCELETEEPSATTVCGNGVCEAGESESSCPAECLHEAASSCGDGVIDAGEECDNGTNDGSYNTCNPNCTLAARCGDGTVNSDISSETCDDGNLNNDDACSDTCQINEGYEVALNYVTFDILPSSVTVGQTAQMVTTAVYTDGTTKNVTSPNTNPGTNYSSSNTGVANATCSICSSFAGIAPGTATITVSYTENGISATNTANLTVSSAPSSTVEICGNGVCGNGEDESSCPDDCLIGDEGESEGEAVDGGEGEGEGETVDGGEGEGESEGEAADGGEGEGEGEVHSAAPVTTILEEAVTVMATETAIDEVAYEVPAEPQEVPQADECILNNPDPAADSDEDGLSDRTECYIGTSADLKDSDGDGCWDGAEVNQFYTNPNVQDCKIEEKTEQYVIISDPQPGWVVPSLDISGVAPKSSQTVSLVAFSAEDKELKAVIEVLENIVNTENSEVTEAQLSELESAVSELEAFVSENSAYEYDELGDAADNLKTKLADIMSAEDKISVLETSNMEDELTNMEAMYQEPIDLGSQNDLSDASIGEETVKGFHRIPDVTVTDGKLYDLVAIATLSGGKTKYSAPVRISVDSELSVSKPVPQSIGNETIPGGAVAFDGFIINGVYAADGDTVEIEIMDDKPVVTGSSEYGTHVFAVWESVVLASSVIADSEEGSFAVEAPRNLETDSSHKVTLYAVKTDGDQKLRSESVNVHFRVLPAAFAWGIVYWVGGITLVLVLMIFFLRKRLRRKPEEEEKEVVSELAEAEKAYEEAEAITEEFSIPAEPEVPVAETPAETAETPVEPVAKEEIYEPVEAPIQETVSEVPAEEIAHEEAEQMREEVIQPAEQAAEPVTEEVTEVKADKPVPPIAQSPDNPVEPVGPTPEEHQQKQEEVMAAFDTQSGQQ